MDLVSLYRSAVERFRERLPRLRGVAVAFNTNIDGIIGLNRQRLEGFLGSQRRTADEAFARRSSPPGRIDDPVDFVVGLMHFMEKGSGGEYMIHNEDTYRWIVSNLPIDEYRMGGNAGIMANALSMLGAEFVIPHAVQLPERQARLFLDRDNILLPVRTGSRVDFAPPSRASRSDRELVHLILEFKEGTSFSWRGVEVVSPRNNRFIANADDFNGKIVVDPAFVEGVDARLREIDKFILTGLHMLKRQYPDGATYLERLDEALGHVRRWKSMNPDLRVHFEMADIQDELIRSAVLDRACPVADSVGLNEDELEAILGTHGLLESGPGGIAEGMARFAQEGGLGKLLLHSKDFVISLVAEGYGVAPDVVRDAEALGILCSQNRASTGEFGSTEDLLNMISSGILEPSATGVELYDDFVATMGDPDSPGIWPAQGGGTLVMMPSLLSKTTLNTVGLGDCLTAGVVLGEIPD